MTPTPAHAVPIVSSNDRAHTLDLACWCGPTVEHVERDDGADLIVHQPEQRSNT